MLENPLLEKIEIGDVWDIYIVHHYKGIRLWPHSPKKIHQCRNMHYCSEGDFSNLEISLKLAKEYLAHEEKSFPHLRTGAVVIACPLNRKHKLKHWDRKSMFQRVLNQEIAVPTDFFWKYGNNIVRVLSFDDNNVYLENKARKKIVKSRYHCGVHLVRYIQK